MWRTLPILRRAWPRWRLGWRKWPRTPRTPGIWPRPATEQRMDNLEQKVDTGFQKVNTGFTEMRGKLDQAAAGQQQIVDLLNMLIAGQDDQ
jgi:hypothetical protein